MTNPDTPTPYAEALAAFEVWYKETYPIARSEGQHKAGRRIIFMAGFKRGKESKT